MEEIVKEEKKNKKKRRKRKKSPGSTAYTVFLSLYVLVLAVGILFGLSRLWSYAKTVDGVGPEPTMKQYIKKLEGTLWSEEMARTVAAMPHEFQSDEECVQIVRNMLQGDLSYQRQPDSVYTDSEAHFDVLCGTNKIGSVTLVRDETDAGSKEYHQLPWKVQSDEFYLDGLYSSVRVTVPENYYVSLNGVLLGQEYIVERGIPYDMLEEYYDEYPDLPKKVTYEAHDVFGILEPVIFDDTGNVYHVDPTKNDSQYLKAPPEEIMDRLEEFAVNFSDQYKHFSAGVGDSMAAYQRVQPYVIAGSDLDRRFLLAMDGYGWAHTVDYQFNGAILNSVIDVGSNCYILDVTVDTTVVYPNTGENGVLREDSGLIILAQDFGTEIRAVSVENY